MYYTVSKIFWNNLPSSTRLTKTSKNVNITTDLLISKRCILAPEHPIFFSARTLKKEPLQAFFGLGGELVDVFIQNSIELMRL